MMTSKKNMLRSGILAGLATVLMAFGVGCGEGEQESKCGENEAYLLIGEGPAQCYTKCSVGEDGVDPCGEGLECRGSGDTAVCREATDTNPDPDPDPDPGACEAETACTSYCEALYGACIDEQCDPNGTVTVALEDGSNQTITVSEFEIELCMNGLSQQDPDTGEVVEYVPSCVARAANEVACEQIEAQAEQIAGQGCGNDVGGKMFVCTELNSYLFNFGSEVFDQCGCEVNPISEACATDEDCSTEAYTGQCISEFEGTTFPEGMCVASCLPGEPGTLRYDRLCGGDTGICFTDPANTQAGICMRSCSDVAECPRGVDEGYGCLPTLTYPGGDAIGSCTLAECTPENADTACEEGQVCHTNGFCVNSCENDDQCETDQICNTDTGSCDAKWVNIFE
ncbi:hypothetical protein DL240_04175 [Lujinxingia litoralis]|uniref:Multiple EGF-like-domain protein 3 n=1 Tax=Lujinxingia litoralis TaxID=2211119 RepID=A0A328CCH2_9DELT|nr:hypothetical protein [Lujinxingia litoralis]RAL25416.1 hypothetical protein DL240_04175 [Lujinxingia litoralis]